YISLLFSSSGDHRDLHSFPTRRSSDLERRSCRELFFLLPFLFSLLMQEVPMYRVHGMTGSGNCHKVRQILELTNQPYEWVEVDLDRKSTRLNSSHVKISYAVFCLKKKM